MFLNFYKRVFNQFENIPPQNKDTEVVSVQKIYLIKLFLNTLELKVLKVVNLNLVFNRKYRWLSVCSMVLRKFSEITNKKPIFSQYNLRFDLFLIIAKKVNQIRNNVVCVAAHLVFVFCYELTAGRCNAFQHIFVN